MRGVLRYTTFENFPLWPADIAKAHAAFPMLRPIADELAPLWGAPEFTLHDVQFRMIVGDARETLPAQDWQADAWFLDGFSPAKNPDLWGDDLMRAVGDHTKRGGTCATFTAAGHVRRALDDAGFDITRTAGFGRKRHMTRGRKR